MKNFGENSPRIEVRRRGQLPSSTDFVREDKPDSKTGSRPSFSPKDEGFAKTEPRNEYWNAITGTRGERRRERR